MAYARKELEMVVGNTASAYRQWHRGELQRSVLDRVESNLYEYVEGLLAEKTAEIKRLEANQVTPDLIALYRAWQAAEYPNEKFEAMRQVMAELGTIIESD